MQAQGAKEDNNPEFAQIMQFLKNLQMQSKMQQQRQSMQQTQQSSPQTSLPAGTLSLEIDSYILFQDPIIFILLIPTTI